MTTLNSIIALSASTYKSKIAFSDESRSITFGENYELASIMASTFIKEGVFNQPIAIYIERNVKQVTSLTSVLLSGNYYVILDTSMPKERVLKIIETLNCKHIICEEKLFLDATKIFEGKNVYVYEQLIKNTQIIPLDKDVMNSDPAFIIFTSGSTGNPKGVVITHLNVINYIEWFISCFNISDKTNFGSQTPLYFSMSVSDLYATFFCGASYFMIPKSYFTFPALLISYLNTNHINTIYWVPTALSIVMKFDLLSYELPKYLEKVLFAGEVMPTKTLVYFQKKLPNILYANLFGPTETTDICSYYIIDHLFKEDEIIPIGKSCKGASLLVIDEDQKEVTKTNKIGELLVRGSFVTKGYINNSEKTNEVFIQNPLHNFYEDKVYKTGDLVIYGGDGNLYYVGRKDYQIKHLGHRIELGEIESVMQNCSYLEHAVCLYDDQKDDIVLIYEGNIINESEIINFANAKLLNYMCPTRYINVESLPINSNGKIDRKKLKNDFLGGK